MPLYVMCRASSSRLAVPVSEKLQGGAPGAVADPEASTGPFTCPDAWPETVMFPHFTDKSPAIDVSVALVTTHWKFPHDFASGTDVDTQLPRFTVEEPEPPPFDPEPDPDPDPVPVGEINPVLDSKLQPANSRAATARTLNPARVLFITTSSLQTRLHAYNFVIATPEDFVKIEDNPFNVDLPAEVSPRSPLRPPSQGPQVPAPAAPPRPSFVNR